MKKFLVLFVAFFVTLPAFCVDRNIMKAERGIVTRINYVDVPNVNTEANQQTKQEVTVKILSGKFKNQQITVDNMLTSNPAYDMILTKGNRVILHLEPKAEFIEDIDDVDFYISDIERVNALYLFAGIFVALLIIIGRKKGILSFVSILATVALIFFGLTPLILNGVSPIWSTLATCILSTIITIYLVGGFNRKSTSAILGTTTSLVFAAISATIAIKVANLTGFAGEEPMFLYSARPDLDFTGILSAAIMLAALGAVMDVGVSIASTINEIHCTDSTLGIKDLFTSGMNVGRDIIGTMSNTLILVYLGSALPLVLLSSNIDMLKFFNLNQVATEIISALIGSIAILICVPLTALISAWLLKTESDKIAK